MRRKKLPQADMLEINREQSLARLQNPETAPTPNSGNSDPAPPGKAPRLLNPYPGNSMRERVSPRFDMKRGLGAGYGVPALAGQVLSREGAHNRV